MFRFENAEYLYLLTLIPLLIVCRLYAIYVWRKRVKRFGDAQLVAGLMPDVSKVRPITKFCILLTALTMLIICFARPQYGTKIDTSKREGIETVIALDVSNSMLAEDVSPNRLERAKMLLSNLVDKMANDKVALVVFAGDAFVQLPITSDYVSAKMFLDVISTKMIQTQGTDLARAISLSSKCFTQDKGVGRAIIVITDGEGHEEGAEEAANEAKQKGMRVFVLGIGSSAGSPIKEPNSSSYMKDNEGNIVMSKLDETMCANLARSGGGAYIHVDDSSISENKLATELSKLTKKEMSSTIYSEYDEQFQAFAIIGLLLMILEVIILERKNPTFKKLKIFKK